MLTRTARLWDGVNSADSSGGVGVAVNVAESGQRLHR